MNIKQLIILHLFNKIFFIGKFNVNIRYIDECSHVINNIEPFYSIDVKVSDLSDILDTLNNLIKEELMNGDNCVVYIKWKKN